MRLQIHFSVLLYLMLVSITMFGQKEIIFELPNGITSTTLQDGKYRYYFYYDIIVRVDTESGEHKDLRFDKSVGNVFDVKKLNDNVCFFGQRYMDDGNTKEAFFMSISEEGDVLANVGFQYFDFKLNMVVANETVYFHGFDSTGTECIWSSNGTQSSTQPIIYQDDIIGLNTINESIYLFSYSDDHSEVLRYANGSTSEISLPQNSFKFNRILGNDQDALYFGTLADSFGISQIYKYNHLSQTFLKICEDTLKGEFRLLKDHFAYGQVSFNPYLGISDLKYGSKDSLQVVSVDIQDEQNPKTYYLHLTDQFFITINETTGFELATVQDGVLKTQELNKGPGSALNYNHYYKKWTKHKDTTYILLTNGNDSYNYLYKLINDSTFQSVIRVEYQNEIKETFIQDGYFYWTEQFRNSDGYWRDRICRKSLSKVERQPIERVNPHEWYRQISVRGRYPFQMSSGNFVPLQTKITKDKSVLTSFLTTHGDWGNQRYFDQRKYDTSTTDGSVILIKYDSLGNRMWTSGYGSTYQFGTTYDNGLKFEINTDGNIIAIGEAYRGFHWDDQLEDFGGTIVKRYILKINGITGKVIWKKTFYPTRYTNPLLFDELVLDEDNNIYIAGMYEDFELTLEGQTVTAPKSPLNVLLKYNANGNLVFLKNMETPWFDNYGRTHLLEYDPSSENLIAIQSQDWFNVWSSCKWDDSEVYFQRFDNEGNLLSTDSLFSDDMMSLTCGDIDSDGHFHGFGYLRGSTKMGAFTYESTATRGCNLDEGFQIKIDSEHNDLSNLWATKNKRCEPIKAKIADNSLYLLTGFYKGSSTSRNYLAVLKFQLDGRFVGHKILNQSYSADYLMFHGFDVRDGKIAVSGVFGSQDTGLNIINSVYSENLPYASILYTSDDNWDTDSTWFQSISPDLTNTKAEFKLYPNPAASEVTLVLPKQAHPYTEYAIYDVKGAEIYRKSLSNNLVETINLSFLNQGLFFIRCFNNDKTLTARLIKI